MSSCKTPVSTLHEMFVVQGITPCYNLIVNGVGSHNPIFKYRLECGHIISHGIGKSKKEARHDAAQNALNQLKNDGVTANGTEEVEKIMVDEANIPVASPYQDVLKQNVVGTLTTLCTSNRISEPNYQLIGEEGPPHCKTFTIQCSVLHLKEVAQARTKKQAKHKSSKQMIDTLQEYFNNCLDFAALEEEVDSKPSNTESGSDAPDKEQIDEIKSKFIAMHKNKPVLENLGLRISDYHTVSTDVNCFLLFPSLENLKSMELDKIDDPYTFLLSLFEGSDIEIVWEDMPSVPNTGYSKSVIVHTSPSWCFVGNGETEQKALNSCSIQMLEYFQTLAL